MSLNFTFCNIFALNKYFANLFYLGFDLVSLLNAAARAPARSLLPSEVCLQNLVLYEGVEGELASDIFCSITKRL